MPKLQLEKHVSLCQAKANKPHVKCKRRQKKILKILKTRFMKHLVFPMAATFYGARYSHRHVKKLSGNVCAKSFLGSLSASLLPRAISYRLRRKISLPFVQNCHLTVKFLLRRQKFNAGAPLPQMQHWRKAFPLFPVSAIKTVTINQTLHKISPLWDRIENTFVFQFEL